MDIIKVFGNNLKKHRTALGLSQEAFAEKSSFPVVKGSRMEIAF